MKGLPKVNKENIKKKLKKFALFIFNPRLLLCFFLAWMITNGWSYVFAFIGGVFDITWMIIVGAAYAGFLWLPFTPEKLLTVIIAIALLRLLFPKDKKTLAVLFEEFAVAKKSFLALWHRIKSKKNEKSN